MNPHDKERIEDFQSQPGNPEEEGAWMMMALIWANLFLLILVLVKSIIEFIKGY